MQNFFEQPNIQQRSLPTSATHNFYLYGEIQSDTQNYVDMITTLDYAQPNDIINIYINTPGGSVNTAISIIHAMMRSQANVMTHADGEVASAGTLIFFAGQSYIVYPFSHFMLHDASEGAMGKISENIKRVHATSELINKLAYELYSPVFSDEEIDDILEGRDYYCTAEEMYDRIKATEQSNEQEEDDNNTDEEVEEYPNQEVCLNGEDEAHGNNLNLQQFYMVKTNSKNGKRHKHEGKTGIIDDEYTCQPSKETVRLVLLTGEVIYISKHYLRKIYTDSNV